MKTRIFLSLLSFYAVMATGICSTWTISNSGFTFTPDTVIIILGDDVDFSIGSSHNAVEVSQETWDANGNTALAGGFSVPFGGGSVSPDLLTEGTHWYVCSPHASAGMKGVIIVQNATSVEESRTEMDISLFPNPAYDLITLRSNTDLLGAPYFLADLAGNIILAGKIDDESSTIDISNFRTGIYLLQVGEQRKRTLKLIIK